MFAADTSIAVAAAYQDHPHFAEASSAVAEHSPVLSGHAAFEAASVLSRMPPGWRFSPATVSSMLRRNFPGDPCWLTRLGAARVYGLFGEQAITGGAVYDALVAQAALDHELTLLSLDRRARRVYDVVGVSYELLR